MHADTLYHRMLAQERAIEDAKVAGKPIPEFAPIVTSLPSSLQAASAHASTSSDAAAPSPSQPPDPTIADLKPSVQAQLAKRFKGLSPAQREVEEKAIAAEIAAGTILARQINQLYDRQAKEKSERKARGEQTWADMVNTWFGW